MSHSYKAVIFDFFGVVCAPVGIQWFERYLPEPEATAIEHSILVQADLGCKSADEVYREAGSPFNVPAEAVHDEWNNLAMIDKHMVHIITSLKPTYHTALCSNAFSDFIRPVLVKNGLDQMFDTIVISSDIKIAKPDPRIFEHTLAQMGIAANESIFIDDNETNVYAARSVGITGVHFTSPAELERELGLLGVTWA